MMVVLMVHRIVMGFVSVGKVIARLGRMRVLVLLLRRVRMDVWMRRRMSLEKGGILARKRRLLLSRLGFGLGSNRPNSLLGGSLCGLLSSQCCFALLYGTSHITICPAT